MPPSRTEKKKNSVTLQDQSVAAFFKKIPKASKAEAIVVVANMEAAANIAPKPAAAPEESPKPKSAFKELLAPKRLPKPVGKGLKDVAFRDLRRSWDGQYHQLLGLLLGRFGSVPGFG
ncbi:hypothetical protein EJ02DRAFT_434260 [Clathrospora elynae]|uniref:Uncharacterized protein n=1 Tax=Clathrospora elynae TaxID=706981 RepID=A0A6A5SN33_9PLEO|nr:hypothetical protein EJ02DRAFT_434260 [Clathrospora elynae]